MTVNKQSDSKIICTHFPTHSVTVQDANAVHLSANNLRHTKGIILPSHSTIAHVSCNIWQKLANIRQGLTTQTNITPFTTNVTDAKTDYLPNQRTTKPTPDQYIYLKYVNTALRVINLIFNLYQCTQHVFSLQKQIRKITGKTH